MADHDKSLSDEQKRIVDLIDTFEKGLGFGYVQGFITPSEFDKILARFNKNLPEFLKARGMEIVTKESALEGNNGRNEG